MIKHPLTKHVLFTDAELADPETHETRFHPGFEPALLALRLDYNWPMRVTSCCRSAAHNLKVGGHPRSLHLMRNPYYKTEGTMAIDIALRDGSDKGALVSRALGLGWSVGVAGWGVHLDRRRDIGLTQVLFTY
ncbi:MAG: D-Ala-D-Ala carboxypeptidase family metallohydrolase [Paracoccaceae bacterium]